MLQEPQLFDYRLGTMSIMFKRSLIASALAAGMLFAGTSAVAAESSLGKIQSADNAIQKDAQKSQNKIDGVFDQTQELLSEYRTVLDEIETQNVYNNHVQRLVDNQVQSLNSLQKQIDGIDATKRGVVPLMYNMIDTLGQFIDLDIPVNLDERKARVAKLRDLMGRADVTTSEKYRQILEAYLVENDYGTKIAAYQGKLSFDNHEITVDFFHLGRVALVAESLDMENAWVWDNSARKWEQLDGEYVRPITQAIRMARKQTAFDLIKLPIPAAGSAK